MKCQALAGDTACLPIDGRRSQVRSSGSRRIGLTPAADDMQIVGGRRFAYGT